MEKASTNEKCSEEHLIFSKKKKNISLYIFLQNLRKREEMKMEKKIRKIVSIGF